MPRVRLLISGPDGTYDYQFEDDEKKITPLNITPNADSSSSIVTMPINAFINFNLTIPQNPVISNTYPYTIRPIIFPSPSSTKFPSSIIFTATVKAQNMPTIPYDVGFANPVDIILSANGVRLYNPSSLNSSSLSEYTINFYANLGVTSYDGTTCTWNWNLSENYLYPDDKVGVIISMSNPVPPNRQLINPPQVYIIDLSCEFIYAT
jgi:hypothetical protein